MTVAGLCLVSVSGIGDKGIKEKTLSLSTTRGSISIDLWLRGHRASKKQAHPAMYYYNDMAANQKLCRWMDEVVSPLTARQLSMPAS